jgi:hypothetical protein
MRALELVRWVLFPGLLAAGACAALSATEPADQPDGSAGPGTAIGTVGTLCRTEIDQCGWTALECSSDPACAQWFACVLDCHPVSGLQGCYGQCGQAGSAKATALQKCLATADGGNCASTDRVIEAGADGDPALGLDVQQQPNYSSCSECVAAMCEAQLYSCTTPEEAPPDCTDYKHLLAECVATGTQAGFEACLLEAEDAYAAAHNDFASSGTMGCAILQCRDNCTPPDLSACLACSASSCADALDAWLRNAQAQALAWCRRSCEGSTACLDTCKGKYAGGAGALSALLACQSTSCQACKL